MKRYSHSETVLHNCKIRFPFQNWLAISEVVICGRILKLRTFTSCEEHTPDIQCMYFHVYFLWLAYLTK